MRFLDKILGKKEDTTREAVTAILPQEIYESGQTIIMVTHEEDYAKMAKRIVRLDDGLIVSDERR